MVTLVKHDLEFILEQIKISEAHAAGTPLTDLVHSPLLPWGVRTVDGSYNNIVPGREQWGASGEPFPRLTAPAWAEGNGSIGFGNGAVTYDQNDYTPGADGGTTPHSSIQPGTVVDANPRIISNLIADQTPANPAAVAAALRQAGHEGDLTNKIAQIRDPYMRVFAAEKADELVDSWGAAVGQAAGRLAAAQTVRNAAFDADQENSTEQTQAALASAEIALSAAQTALSAAQASLATAIQTNAAAQAAAIGAQAQLDAALTALEVEMDGKSLLLPNAAPDEGLSASYNSWFTLFGQFFDHGLDLVAKGGNGTVYIPLQPDDPLYNPASPHTNFMAVTRVAVDPGPDGVLGTADDIAPANVTTPWVDQNQTYTSHASHQVFLREYKFDANGRPVATGHLLEGKSGGLATWGDVKAHALTMLGIELTDIDVFAVPLIRTDAYGKFIPHPTTGFAQVIVDLGPDGIPNTDDDIVVSATIGAGGVVIPVSPADVGAIRIANAFLDDIAHSAVPVQSLVPVTGGNGEPVFAEDGITPIMRLELRPDADDVAGNAVAVNGRGQNIEYDNELLDAHYITGDGRGNENIGLTAVHFVFHAEHNRLVEHTKQVILASGDLAFINQWLSSPVNAIPTSIADLDWNGERLFQAARFTTEMQYQHLVFEEFARKVQPDIDIFMVQPDVEINPAIFAEFAHVVYRFGHSMLNETVDQIRADGSPNPLTLFEAFLNPLAFGTHVTQGNHVHTADHAAAAGAIIRGMTAQVGNEIDEFTTNVLRNQLVGIPLDLAAINIARGRDTGIPSLNEARAQFKAMANGDSQLDPYTSWVDFALNMKNPESIVNFIAAYGTHASIIAAQTVEEKRDAAMELVFGIDMNGDEMVAGDRFDFLNSRGPVWSNQETGLNNVDLWIGGLAEKKMPFGGMLGSTFAFIFELQMENLQHADRFYYLSRVQGLNLLTELENNSLAKIIMRNTDLGETGFALPGDVFSVPDHVFYMNYQKQLDMTGLADPTHSNPTLEAISNLVERGSAADPFYSGGYIRYNGSDHIVIMGTNGNDHIIAGGGDDTVWGGAGHDRIEAGYGVDKIMGGDGDDIITNAGTDIGETDMLHGDGGNDVIHGGSGHALIFGGSGKDFLMTGPDGSEIRGGTGDDFILGGNGPDALFGNEGDDWIEGGGLFDYIAGDNGELFFNSTVIGHDVLNGGGGDTDYDADSGDDIMVGGEGIQKFIGMWGHDWVIHKGQKVGADADMNFPVFPTLPMEVLRDRYSQVEALSGWKHDDILRGDDRTNEVEEGPTGLPFPDPTPEGNFIHNELDLAGIARIAGLNRIITDGTNGTPNLMRQAEYWADGTGTVKSVFDAGNILLGGGGSDLFEGRGGDDVIDGDAWLNVRIRFEHSGTAYTVDSMAGQVYLESAYLAANAEVSGLAAQFDGRTLDQLMLARVVNPGALHIQREILWDDSGVDVALYWDVRENYTITHHAGGRVTVHHHTQTEGAIDPITGKNRTSDGTDTLYNIEILRFADGDLDLRNEAPVVGNDVIYVSDSTNVIIPWSVLLANDIDPDGDALTITAVSDLTGVGNNTITVTRNANNQTITFTTPNLNANDITGNSFTYTVSDGKGGTTTGTVDVRVLNVNNGGNDTANIAAPAYDYAFINTGGGNDTFHAGSGTDVVNGGTGNDTAIFAGPITRYDISHNGTSIVVTDLTGQHGPTTLTSFETLRFGGQNGTNYEVVTGTNQINNNLNGNNGQPGSQAVFGLGGNDTLNGGTGADYLDGGTGNDTLNGGTGDDILVGGAGNDTLNGDGGTDTAVYRGPATNFNFATSGGNQSSSISLIDLSGAEGTDTLNSIEQIRFDGTTYNLVTSATNTARGNANTLNGGNQADLILGFGGNDTLNGGGGDDILVGGSGNDTINGGTGDDLIIWNANNAGTGNGNTDNRDIVNGGDGTDTFAINGNGNAETYRIYTRSEWLELAGNDANQLHAQTEIVITRNGTGNNSVIAELRNVEEIVINGRGGGDTFIPIGDFTATSLSTSTITLEGGAGDDIVDISALTSAHRVVFKGNGGNDTIVGTLRPQDVVELASGKTIDDYSSVTNADGSTTISTNGHSVTFFGTPEFARGQDHGSNGGQGGNTPVFGGIHLDREDLRDLRELANALDRDASGYGNNVQNPGWGTAGYEFIRLTEASYSDGASGIRQTALNPREISNIVSNQDNDGDGVEESIPNAFNGSALLTFFGQYFDHGLSFVAKGNPGTVNIGTVGDTPLNAPRSNIVEGTGIDPDGIPNNGNEIAAQYINQTSPFVDQNQTYGSHNEITNLLRKWEIGLDGQGKQTAYMLTGELDASGHYLLPTLNHVRDNYRIMTNGDELKPGDVADYNGTGHPLLIDFIPAFVTLPDQLEPTLNLDAIGHYFITGDGRANENVMLTSVHTIWARNHNFWVDKLKSETGGSWSEEEYFQAARIMNIAEYQRVVFTEFATAMAGGLGDDDSGPDSEHGFKGYDPTVDASISVEFAQAAYRFGHSMLNETVTYLDVNGQLQNISLVQAFLQPNTMAELGVDALLGGAAMVRHQAIDVDIVNALRNQLVGRPLDLAALNIFRGRDMGIAPFNEVRAQLGLRPYTGWDDFKNRNDLSDAFIDQLKEAYPEGFETMDLYIGGLAEKARHGQLGSTFGYIFLEQLDRLQHGDRFYYLEILDDSLFEDNPQTFADIIMRNTGLTNLPSNIFLSATVDPVTSAGGETPVVPGEEEEEPVIPGEEEEEPGPGEEEEEQTPPPAGDVTFGTPQADYLVGTAGNDVIFGEGGDDRIFGGDGDDHIHGGAGDDIIYGDGGDDLIFGDAGNDRIFGGDGDDVIHGGAGDDIVYGGAGDDTFVAAKGDGDDAYHGGEGSDTLDMSAITANITADLGTGFKGRGHVVSEQTGTDTIWGVENIILGSGQNVVTASSAVNVMDGGLGTNTFRFLSAGDADGDTILGFKPGDRIDLSGMDADACAGGKQSFTLMSGEAFTGRGQLIFTHEQREDGDYTVVQGNTYGGLAPEFKISIKGTHQLTAEDFIF